MPYFFYDGTLEVGDTAIFSGEEAKHALQVRRLKKGEALTLQDLHHRRFKASLVEKQRHDAVIFIQEEIIPPQESLLQLEIIFALCKEKALHFGLQKLTELGVSRIALFQSNYSSHWTQKSISKWQRIVLEACKQSERWKPPQIVCFPSLKDVLQSYSEPSQLQWVLHPKVQSQHIPKEAVDSCRIIIGAEGGLTQDELAIATEHGYHAISCGHRILRAETAAVAIASYLQFLYGDLL